MISQLLEFDAPVVRIGITSGGWPVDPTNVPSILERSQPEIHMAAKKPRRTGTARGSISLGRELDRRAREVLINARVAANLTQQELAARLGRAQSFVSRIEHGPLAIERDHFVAIARTLGEDPHALFAKVIAGPIGRASRTRGSARTRR